MKNREDRFEVYFGMVYINNEIALGACQRIINYVVLKEICCANQRKEVSFATETFLYDRNVLPYAEM